MADPRELAVARGATPGRGGRGSRQGFRVDASGNESEAAAHLQRLGWGEVQAAGIVAGLDRFPPWEKETDWRWPLLHDWASANQHQDPTTLETQLRFLSEELQLSPSRRLGSVGS